MATNVHIIQVIRYGRDWQRIEKIVTRSKETVDHYASGRFEEEELKVSGINDVEVDIERNISAKRAFEHLTLNDYLTLYGADAEQLKVCAHSLLEGETQ